MGKLIISTHITVDGVIGPSPGDWAILEGEGERYKFDQLLAADAFLLGRKVYEGLASVWPTITDDTGFAERVNSIPKYVASRTLEEPLEWNASLIEGDLAERVAGLKRQHRGNLISFGCGELAYELATQGLADETHFWVNPAVWGSGDRAFHGRQVRMQLIATTAFDSGITLLCYRPAPPSRPARQPDRARLAYSFGEGVQFRPARGVQFSTGVDSSACQSWATSLAASSATAPAGPAGGRSAPVR